jgi:SNF2 family DNA or RNA helicase
VIEVELYFSFCGNLLRTTMQKKWYRAILERNFTWLKKGASSKNFPNLMNVMMELRKVCNHPFLLKGAEDRILLDAKAVSQDEKLLAMIQASGKLGISCL